VKEAASAAFIVVATCVGCRFGIERGYDFHVLVIGNEVVREQRPRHAEEELGLRVVERL
jgi:hypothetical protein